MKLEELKAYREEILAIAKRHHAPNIRVFGSVARGESTKDSDVDFLVDVAPEQSVLDLGDFWERRYPYRFKIRGIVRKSEKTEIQDQKYALSPIPS